MHFLFYFINYFFIKTTIRESAGFFDHPFFFKSNTISYHFNVMTVC